MVKVATIGTNFIADLFMEAVKEIIGCECVTVYSRKKETAWAFAKKNKIPEICVDLNELANNPGVDAVYISSPNSLHFEQAALMLSHGKHVLCEKAVTSNGKELEVLLELADKHQVVFLEAMRPVFDPGFSVIAENIKKLGKVRRVSFQYCQYSSRYNKFKEGIIENAFKPEMSNGALMDIGIYCIHPLVKLFGKPDKIIADGIKLSNGVDGAGTILVSYPECQGELLYSKISNNYIPSQIQGEAGSMVIRQIQNPRDISIFYNDGTSEKLEIEDAVPNNMIYELREWIRLIKNKESAQIHNQYSLMEMQVIDEVKGQLGIVFPADKEEQWRKYQ